MDYLNFGEIPYTKIYTEDNSTLETILPEIFIDWEGCFSDI